MSIHKSLSINFSLKKNKSDENLYTNNYKNQIKVERKISTVSNDSLKEPVIINDNESKNRNYTFKNEKNILAEKHSTQSIKSNTAVLPKYITNVASTSYRNCINFQISRMSPNMVLYPINIDSLNICISNNNVLNEENTELSDNNNQDTFQSTTPDITNEDAFISQNELFNSLKLNTDNDNDNYLQENTFENSDTEKYHFEDNSIKNPSFKNVDKTSVKTSTETKKYSIHENKNINDMKSNNGINSINDYSIKTFKDETTYYENETKDFSTLNNEKIINEIDNSFSDTIAIMENNISLTSSLTQNKNVFPDFNSPEMKSILIKALTECILYKPEDPIEYIANFLYHSRSINKKL